MKNSFILYNNYQKHLAVLTLEQKGILLDALFQYSENGETPELEPVLMMAFNFIAEDMDINRQKWEEMAEVRSEAGKKGAEARWKGHKKDSNDNNKMANDGKRILPMANDGKNAVNVNGNVNVNANVKTISKDMGVTTPVSQNNSHKKKTEYGNTDINKLIKGLNRYLQIKLPEDGRARRVAKNSLDLFTKHRKDGTVKEGREFMDENKWENVKWFLAEYVEKKVKKGYSAQSWDTLYKNIKIWVANNGSLGDK